MDIDLIVSSRELFGSDRSAVGLAVLLQDLGHVATLVLPNSRPERGLQAFAQSHGIQVAEAAVAIATSRGLESVRGVVHRRSRGGPRPNISVINSASILGSSRPSGARVLMLREWLEPGSRKHRLLARWHAQRVDLVVGVSKGVLRQWSTMSALPEHQAVSWNWLSPEWLDWDTPHDRAGIVCVGRFNQWKGQELLAEAFEIAFGQADVRPTLQFVGYEPGTAFGPMAERLREKGDSGRLWHVEPFTSDTREVYASAELVVVPSLHPEPFGRVLVEALAAGCRVLATSGGGPEDLAPLFPGVIRVVPPTADALAEGLASWAAAGLGAQTQDELQRTAATLRQHFSPDAARDRWCSLLSTVCPPEATGA